MMRKRNGAGTLQNICLCATRILFRSAAQLVQMGFMPRFLMMISYRFRKFWNTIGTHIFRRFIFMRAVYVAFPPPVHDLTCPKNQDFTEAINYLRSAIHSVWPGYTRWIRHSTGRLCTALTPAHDNLKVWVNPPELPSLSGMYPLNAGAEIIMTFIDSLTLEHYHHICYHNLSQYRRFNLSTSTTMNVGAVFRCSSNALEDSVEIAFLSNGEAPHLDDWTMSRGDTGEVMPNGRTRFKSGDVFNSTLFIPLYTDWGILCNSWLSQANDIFCCLHITSNFKDYVIVDGIRFDLDISETTRDPPEGFLFLCPLSDFRIGDSSFRWPACPAYWCLDPSGADPLSPEEATQLGFPSFELTTKADGMYWDANVYEGLRQFHKAKGFDPYSQEVTRHLGLPFFRLSSERDAPPWTYVDSDDNDFDADIDSDCNSAYTDEYESEYPPTSACHEFDVDAGASHSEEDVHDSAGGGSGSEHTDIPDCEVHDASKSMSGALQAQASVSMSGAPQARETIKIQKDILEPTLSWPLRCLMATHLALILFLALSWVYDHISISFSSVYSILRSLSDR
ncbi:hypothetical protein MSAN_00124900 [Mycena sanguinolenta]|uniref:Uncharacterized protein n=1 Tax=Mycena sanguinolenta TaxID=230812 RepID=A0A8H7DMX6_9AGAR|nr:hypothetical protein MSAN_00124900 [Mycena sanguinolenta]